MQTKDGQPLVGSPHNNVLAIITHINKSEITQKSTPIIEAIAKGAAEKEIIPSIEYKKKKKKKSFKTHP